jgi:hypothetical protein
VQLWSPWGSLYSFLRFVLEGIANPAPVAPTKRLVVGGLYRHVRNPMYLAVLAVIAGQALALAQASLLLYGALVGLAFGLFVHWYEEPALRRQFGRGVHSCSAGLVAPAPSLGRRSRCLLISLLLRKEVQAKCRS